MPETGNVQSIRERLKNLSTDRDVKALFIEELNFEPRDLSLSPIDALSQKVAEPVCALRIIAGYQDFDVILCVLNRLLKSHQRPIFEQLSATYYHSLLVFTDANRSEWHFCNLKHIERRKKQQEEIVRRIRPFRRIVVGKTERLRTASERIALSFAEEQDTGLTLHAKCDEAFDVEAVSNKFYEDFVHYYKAFRDSVREENDISSKISDEFTQTIFNRLLFLYYVQKKGFLDKNPYYLLDHFKECAKDNLNYYSEFLIPLFKRLSFQDFECPNLGDVPFLNGGLFQFESEEEEIELKNSWFQPVFEELFERYNFTVREDTEFEQEIAINPEMLGTIFERLILGLESKEFSDIPDPRRTSGSYYTPKFIVAFMVKQSLVSYLEDKCRDIDRKTLKKVVYEVDVEGLDETTLKKIRDALMALKAVDPGVGSGAFQVGLLLKMTEVIEAIDRRLGRETSSATPGYRYELKRRLIENNIYGVDIQPRAVHLAELRLWLTLLVDEEEPEPLPNLEFHILKGDSLVSQIGGKIPFDLQRQVKLNTKGENLLDKFHKLKTDYEKMQDPDEKKKQKELVEQTKRQIFEWFLKARKKELKESIAQEHFEGIPDQEIEEKRKAVNEKIKEIDGLLDSVDEMTKTFNWGLDFAEIMTLNGGFDIVIGNPPYGVKVPTEVKNEFGLGSRDSYGVFASLGLKILRTEGTLCYIMSDTWQTIRTHKDLRDQLLSQTDVRYLISVPNDTFKQTVNPGVYLFKKRHSQQFKLGGDNWILAADFSPLSIETGDVEVAFELLSEIDKFDETKDGEIIWSDREMAIFAYRQKLIPRFSNHSFFIASPKLFRLMQDIGNRRSYKSLSVGFQQLDMFQTEEQLSLFQGKGHDVYRVDFYGKELELVKLGDIADVVDFDLVLKEEELERIAGNEPLRFAVIIAGIVEDIDSPYYGDLDVEFDGNVVNVYDWDRLLTISGSGNQTFKLDKPHSLSGETYTVTIQDRYFEGRYYVPYDKGGASDIEEGWLPNYYVPTDYFIDWSEHAVYRMRTLTIRERNRQQGKSGGSDSICSRFQNSSYYFQEGISFSITGIYAPTFKSNSLGIFDVKGSEIFPSQIAPCLTILCSKLNRYLCKNFIQHNVDFQVDRVKKIPIISSVDSLDNSRSCQIISKQKQNPRYDYMTNEQQEIDYLIYQLYNLNDEDIEEVESWFWRRYPKLAEAIEKKM